MDKWFMLTVIGKDRPGIVAKITAALYDGGCHLGEASMMRLGGNFAIMLMVRHAASGKLLFSMVEPVAESLGLHLHVDSIKGKLHQHMVPDVRLSISGADRAGIVASVTNILAQAGLHILDLESDVAGDDEHPIYIMHIEGHASEGMDSLQAAVELIKKDGIDVHLSAIDTVIG
jgi:glycine cleavage system transcriptional repressor